jgi:tripartite-type tricarboxylate transporter receptor subunit TctC
VGAKRPVEKLAEETTMKTSFPVPVRCIAAIALAAGATLAHAQAWPQKPVTVVVPWPAGGPSDIAARPVAKGLHEGLGKPFVVENRGGAGGNIGSAFVAKGPADGSLVLITSSAPIVINPSVYKQMPFNPATELTPVTNILRVPLVLVVHPSVPAKNLQELMAHIKTQQGKFQYASSGNGTPQHLTGELFKTVGKLDMVHVPYKGSAPAINDVVGGHAPIMFDSTIAILPFIASGKVKAIAVTGAKRSPQLPDVPTFAEAGLPGVESYAWYGLFVTAKTPKEIVNRLNAETVKYMKQPDFQKILKDTGSEFVGDTPENFAAFVKAEAAKWGKIAKQTGATVD